MEDKYKNDKYDRELYIPKGYILPDSTMLTKHYARFHEDMAKKFVHENYHNSFVNDVIEYERDYMLMRLGAIQVMSCGRQILLFCDKNQNNYIQNAIVSYLSYGWEQCIVPNPYENYFEYLRYLSLGYDLYTKGEVYEKEINNENVLKRCRKI